MPLITDIQQILRQARQYTINSINLAMVQAYWLIGRRIVEEEQLGENRAAYGKELMKTLSKELKKEFGKGFSIDNLENMRRFYVTYPITHTLSAQLKSPPISDILQKTNSETVSRNLENAIQSPIPQTVSAHLRANTLQKTNSETVSRNLQTPGFQLGWSHYLLLLRIEDKNERSFYEIEAAKNHWSLRELKRQFDSSLYLRLALSTDKEGVRKLASVGQIIESPRDAIKDPIILEFLDLPQHYRYSENDLENELIDKLEHFLLELGTGFTFVARQKRITFDEKNFYIDLVFYNRLLRCFVVIDLKIGELQHQDIGQIQMYVNYYDRHVKTADENKTIGIILCRDKSDTLVEITLPEDNDQVFASRYKTLLPDKEVLKKLLEDKHCEG